MATREEVIDAAKKVTGLLKSPEFAGPFKEKVVGEGMMFANQLFETLEEMQLKAMEQLDLPHGAVKTLQHLKLAMKSYPNDDEVKQAMLELVQTEETLLDDAQRAVMAKSGIEVPPANQSGGNHGHSHNGVPCHGHGQAAGGNHGHSHGATGGNHGHSHGGGNHGHSHNGVPCHGHGGSHGHSHGGNVPGMPTNPQQMAAMQMAMASLSDRQKQDLNRLQMKMMMGQPPTREDQQTMAGIQQHLAAYTQTMQMAVQSAQTKK
jgi:hypothetical protein